LYQANQIQNAPFVKKTGTARKKRAPSEWISWRLLKKLRLPRKGQNTSDAQKAFPRQTTKRLLGRDEFFQRIFLSKSQDWVIVGG